MLVEDRRPGKEYRILKVLARKLEAKQVTVYPSKKNKKTRPFCPDPQIRLSYGRNNQKFNKMEARVNLFEKAQNGLKPLFGLGAYVKNSTIERPLLELIVFRISQINGCAYCIDMHAKDARAIGETEQRLYAMSTWREMPFYTEREKAALTWAEAVNSHHVPREIFDEAKAQLSDEELIDLTLAVSNVSTWNKLNLAFHPLTPGSYTVGQFG
jgi:AhpD family alkylhydroperoxidase